jgi:hypothetical protein
MVAFYNKEKDVDVSHEARGSSILSINAVAELDKKT